MPEVIDGAALLDYMGTDGAKWAVKFTETFESISGPFPSAETYDEFVAWMTGWFANAIEAGRAAGPSITDEDG